MKRRGFLKGLGAIAASAAVIIPAEIKAVASKKELTNLEKAEKIDKDFNSPFLYAEATQDIHQGDVVMFDWKYKPYGRGVMPVGDTLNKACGIATQDIKAKDWGFLQTVGHCKLPVRKENYFKSF